MTGPRLVIIPFGAWCADGDRLFLTEKLVSGLRSIADRWPGPVVFAAQRRPAAPDVNLGSRWFSRDELPMEAYAAEDLQSALATLRPDVISAGLEYARAWLANSDVPVVYTAEFTADERRRNTLSTTTRRLDRARVRVGAARQSRAIRHMVTSAAGIQCNGWPTFEAYSTQNDNCLLFYDTRLVAHAVRTPRPRGSGPLTVAFSGRLIDLKGPMDAVAAVKAARSRGHNVRLWVYGEGPLSDRIAASLGPEDEFLGNVNFEKEWLAQVYDNVDLMLLPYYQGDPAGTFLEAGGLGVPTLGYDSVALQGLVREEGIGWTVGIGNIDALARKLGQLETARHEISEAGARAAAVMRAHDFDTEFDRRVEHLAQAQSHSSH